MYIRNKDVLVPLSVPVDWNIVSHSYFSWCFSEVMVNGKKDSGSWPSLYPVYSCLSPASSTFQNTSKEVPLSLMK